MNSLSNKNNEDCYEHHKKCIDPCPPRFCEFKEHEDLHPLGGLAILEIGKGYPLLINNANASTITVAAPLLLAQVTLDPTALCFPNLKIEFSSLITITGTIVAGDFITAQLSRIRYGYSYGPVVKEPLQTFSTLLPPITSPATISIPLSFINVEENIKIRESTYVVEIVAAKIATTAANAGGSVQFSNVNFAALAVGGARID